MPGLKTIWVAFLYFVGFPAIAQQVIFKTYTVQDGLVANQVRKVMQDSKGFIWIATWEGVSRYDGHKFINYNSANGLSSDVVNDIFEGSDNSLYIAENNQYMDVIRFGKVEKSLRQPVAINRFIQVSASRVIAISDNVGVGEFKSGKLIAKPRQGVYSVQDFAMINDSLMFVFDADYKAIILDNNLDVFAREASGFVSESIARDSKKNIWLCGAYGLKLLDPDQLRGQPIKFLPLPPAFRHPFLKDVWVKSLFEDADGNYWISTPKGLVRISPDGRTQLFTVRNGLPTNLVTDLFQDREKNIWMSSQLGLVKLVMKNDIQFFGKENGLESDIVRGFAEGEAGHFYFNNDSRIFRMSESDFSIEAVSPKRPYFALFKNPSGSGYLSIGDGMLLRSSGQNCKEEFLGKVPQTDLYGMAMDSKRSIFAGSHKGIYVKLPNKPIERLALTTRVTTLTTDNNENLIAGTWDEGIYRIKIQYGANGIQATLEDLTPIVNDMQIRGCFVDKTGHIWVGTRHHGIYRLTESTPGKWKKVHFDREDGLSSNWVNTFVEDHYGNIWVGTHSGLNKLIPENGNYRIFNFSRLNNYFGNVYAIHLTSRDIIWCGGDPGFVRLRDDHVDTLPAPPVSITSIIGGTDQQLSSDKAEVLPYKNNQLYFEFSSPGFINEKSILYSFRLNKSESTAWSIPSNQHSVSYPSIEPGHYTFEVRAYGWNGKPGKIESFTFTIQPPFWRTWWFYSILALALALVLYGIYKYRIHQLLKWQNARDRIATDLHDDIGSSLTNISILSELSSKHLHHPEEAEKFLHRITEEVHSSSQAMDDIIWSVNSQNDSLEETMMRMRRYTAELFDGSTKEYHLQLDENIKGRKLNMEQRKDTFLMYKEILNNINKHADADKVWITVKLVDNHLRLNIKDNGKGFVVNNNSHRNGLKNIYHRAGKWKGRVTIQSKEGSGTEIEIILPLSG